MKEMKKDVLYTLTLNIYEEEKKRMIAHIG